MGYCIHVKSGKLITKEMLQQFRASVVDHKSCPCYIPGDFPEAESGFEIIVAGSYTGSGHLRVPFVERMVRYFRKVFDIELHPEWDWD